MKGYYKEYEKLYNELFERLKTQCSEITKNARAEETETAYQFFSETILNPKIKDIGNSISELGTAGSFTIQWDNRYKLNKHKDKSEIFNELIEEIEPAKRDNTVALLAEQKAHSLMSGYLGAESLKRNVLPTADEQIESYGEKKSNKEFTTARQVLTFYYLFEYLGVQNIDKTVKARFIQFITGKEANTTIKNTNIIKYLAKPFEKKEGAQLKDLQFVREHFEKLGLTKIAELINNDITKYQ